MPLGDSPRGCRWQPSGTGLLSFSRTSPAVSGRLLSIGGSFVLMRVEGEGPKAALVSDLCLSL